MAKDETKPKSESELRKTFDRKYDKWKAKQEAADKGESGTTVVRKPGSPRF